MASDASGRRRTGQGGDDERGSAQSARTPTLLVRDGQGAYRTASTEEVLDAARRVLGFRVRRGAVLSSPQMVKDHLRLRIGLLEHEVFCVLFLDARHRLIADRILFRGTVTQAPVYPREVVKEALAVNAAAVILAHNHPSGSAEPSPADTQVTREIRSALALVEVEVLDHLVISGDHAVSLAERRLL